MGEVAFIGFLRYGVHNVLETHRLTDSLTDGQTPIQNTPGAVLTMAEAQKYECNTLH